MNRNRFIAAAIVAIVLTVTINEAWTHIKLSRLENAVIKNIAAADAQKQKAEILERKTYEYIQKIEHLNAELEKLRTLAKKQDAELAVIFSETDIARRDYQRARNGTNNSNRTDK